MFVYFCGYILRILSDVLGKMRKNRLHHSYHEKNCRRYSVKKSPGQTNDAAAWFAEKKSYYVLARKEYRKSLCAEVGKTRIDFSASERGHLVALYVAAIGQSVAVLFLRMYHDVRDVR